MTVTDAPAIRVDAVGNVSEMVPDNVHVCDEGAGGGLGDGGADGRVGTPTPPQATIDIDIDDATSTATRTNETGPTNRIQPVKR